MDGSRRGTGSSTALARATTLVVCAAVVGLALLALRQARLQAAHELTQSRRRIAAQTDRVDALLGEIALAIDDTSRGRP
ncbi:MAG: hypothetical protein AAFR38_12150 [Planctomycetota bacterium]